MPTLTFLSLPASQHTLHMSLPAVSDSPQIALGNVDASIPTFGTHNAPLAKALSLTLSTREHLMITGSIGVGKAAVVGAIYAGTGHQLG